MGFLGRVDIHMTLSAGARLGPYEVLSPHRRST
jgi:hypothetical protein